MITIAICDDDKNELNITMTMCNHYINTHQCGAVKMIPFTSPTELNLKISREEKFDIILLDIYMPEMTGIELARSLRENNNDCQIIFLTTSLAHAIEAFSLHAAHYLVKPFHQKQFDDAFMKAITAVEKRLKAHITLKTVNGVQKINLAEFLYAETERHIQNICLSGDKYLQVRISSNELFDLLSDDNRFFKCGSTYIINLGLIEEVTNRYILFEQGLQIPMLRRQYKELLDRYTSYALEGN